MSVWQRMAELITGIPDISLAEAVLRVGLIVCLVWTLAQWALMMVTRWGDQRAMSKSFVLAVLVHLCLGLGWAAIISGTVEAELPGDPAPVPIREILVDSIEPPPFAIESRQATTVELPSTSFERSLPSTEVAALSPATPQPASSATLPQPDLPVMTSADSSAPLPAAERTATTAAKPSTAVPVPEISSDSGPIARRDQTVTTMQRSRGKPAETSERSEAVAESRPQPAGPRGDPSRSLQRMRADALRSAISGTPGSGDTGPAMTPQRSGNSGSPNSPLVRRPTPSPTGQPVEPPPPAPNLLRGLIIDGESGQPVVQAVVRIDRADGQPLLARTGANGVYQIELKDLPETFAVAAVHPDYQPQSRSLRFETLKGRTSRIDFALTPVNESAITVEESSQVHHVGNDQFQGPSNSQFQRKAEGPSVALRFTLTAAQLRPQFPKAVLVLMAKGMQCPAEFLVNGTPLVTPVRPSPEDGSFEEVAVPFRAGLLREGVNEVRIQGVNCYGDLDDFEFLNVQIKLTR